MQYTNIYLMLNGVKTYYSTKMKKKNYLKIKKIMTCKFVMACRDKNVIHDSTIQKKKKSKKNYMLMWHVIPCHILTWDLIYPFFNF